MFAFLSYWVQLPGLVGENGILPAKILLEAASYNLEEKAYYYFPTLAWLSSSDSFLNTLSIAGVALSIVLILGYFTLPIVIILYIFYLSLVVVGQSFMSFQWDSLLLETGFLAIFIAPRNLLSGSLNSQPPSKILIFLFWFLLFRLMFSSGIGKIVSGDPTWKNLTALNFHYFTQPLPNPVAWYIHQLPEFFHKISVAIILFIETIVPLFFFAPRILRHTAGVLTIIMQIIIMITGNYTYFNILSITICLLLFDNKFLVKLIPEGIKKKFIYDEIPKAGALNILKKTVIYCLAASVIFIGSLQLYTTVFGYWSLPISMQNIVKSISPLRTFNRYGLFTVMTTTRPEIIIEGSNDGVNWKEYKFKHKPSDLDGKLPVVAPYQPRLDWQMWFAALGNYRNNPWFIRFIEHLGKNTPEVLNLLLHNPFPDDPPKYFRALSYDYSFTNYEERKKTGNIWKRELIGVYLPESRLN
ncbi:MAG: lipase maturation factor family protein [Thermodesulfobacteriota bacterium]